MVINYMYHMFVITIGIVADLALNRYMKLKRNRGVEVKLVPWKTPSHNQGPFKPNDNDIRIFSNNVDMRNILCKKY